MMNSSLITKVFLLTVVSLIAASVLQSKEAIAEPIFIGHSQILDDRGKIVDSHKAEEFIERIQTEKRIIEEEKLRQIQHEKDVILLAKLIQREANGEGLEGKVAVGNVVMNRIEDKRFPNTISEVIYQPKQFEPVLRGILESAEPDELSWKAAKMSINKEVNYVDNALFFFNPSLTDDEFVRSRQVIKRIGGHVFAY